MQFEKKAQQYILDNIRASYSGKRGLISRIESFEEDTARQILTAFDDKKVMSFREGVKWLPANNTNV